MRLAPIAVAAFGLSLAVASAAQGHGCGRRALREGGEARFVLHRAFLGGGGGPDCVESNRVAEPRPRRGARGGYYEIHGRYQH